LANRWGDRGWQSNRDLFKAETCKQPELTVLNELESARSGSIWSIVVESFSSRDLDMFRRFHAILVTSSILPAIFTSLPVRSQTWYPVRGSIEFGISGMAVIDRVGTTVNLLVVHDNKDDGQGRLATISLRVSDWPTYREIGWADGEPLPVDLEALSAVPGTDTFVAVNSRGTAYHVALGVETDRVRLLGTFVLPDLPEGSNVESFALQNVEGRLLAVWAHRGQGEDPAVLYWAEFDAQTYAFSAVSSEEIRVPYPIGAVRHISDLKVDTAGVAYATAASDNGNDGPFASAAYVLGRFDLDRGTTTFHRSPLVSMTSDPVHKVEAIELLPGEGGGLLLGTDDESFGSFIWRSHEF